MRPTSITTFNGAQMSAAGMGLAETVGSINPAVTKAFGSCVVGNNSHRRDSQNPEFNQNK
jgi:hypothetical protein